MHVALHVFFQLLSRNASLIQTVHPILHALVKSVKIHALHCLVVSEQHARQNDTGQSVFVSRALLGILMKYAKNVSTNLLVKRPSIQSWMVLSNSLFTSFHITQSSWMQVR